MDLIYLLSLIVSSFIGVLIGFLITIRSEDIELSGATMICGAFLSISLVSIGIPLYMIIAG